MEERTILITGGSGFVGRHMAKKFSDMGYNVRIFDIAEPKYPLDKNTEFIKGDIFNIDSITAAINDVSTVIHLVGLADAGVAQKNPMKSFHLNILSLQNILEACRICGNKKIIFPSSLLCTVSLKICPLRKISPFHRRISIQHIKSSARRWSRHTRRITV